MNFDFLSRIKTDRFNYFKYSKYYSNEDKICILAVIGGENMNIERRGDQLRAYAYRRDPGKGTGSSWVLVHVKILSQIQIAEIEAEIARARYEAQLRVEKMQEAIEKYKTGETYRLPR